MEKNFPWYRWISSRGEDLDMPFTILNFPVKFVSLFEHGHYLSKIGEVSLTTWSLMNSGRRMVTKIGFLPFLRGQIRLRKLRQISESPKRHWTSVPWNFSFAVFDPKAKKNFEIETLYRVPISGHALKLGTPEHRTTEHGTPAKYRNSGRTLMELWNTGGKTDHLRNKWNKRTPT